MVRAKFRYTNYTAGHMTVPKKDENGKELRRRGLNGQDNGPDYETVEFRTMTFVPVHSSTTYDENRLFWEATPQGKLELMVTKPSAWEKFTLGKAYYLDFSEALG